MGRLIYVRSTSLRLQFGGCDYLSCSKMVASSSYVHYIAFLGIESHPPGAVSPLESLLITLECLLFRHRSNVQV